MFRYQKRFFVAIIFWGVISQSFLAASQDVVTNDGATLIIDANATFYVSGDLTNQGTGNITNNGTLRLLNNLTNNATFSSGASSILSFEGTDLQEILGSNNLSIQNLVLDNANGLKLNQSIDVTGNLTFNSGNLDLNNQIINLSSTGMILNETSGTQVVDNDPSDGGYVQIQLDLNAPTLTNAGGLGLLITSIANLGTTTIRRGHDAQDNTANANTSILRYYDITPTNNTGLDMTLRFTYDDSELAGQDESTLEMWKASTPYDEWEKLVPDSRDVTLNFVEKTGIASASRFTLSDVANPLPITLLAFEARQVQQDVMLHWVTTQEINNQKFIVERSPDALQFEAISTIAGKGTAKGPFSYSFTDVAPFNGNQTLYYRLKQVDFNQQFSYSPIRAVKNEVTSLRLQVYPNPFVKNIQVEIISTKEESTQLQVLSSQGQLIHQQTLALKVGLNQLELQNLENLAPGVYVVKSTINQQTIIKKIVKK